MKLWKGKRAGRVVAWLLAGAMVLSGLTVTPVSAEEETENSTVDVSGNDLGGVSQGNESIMLLSDGDTTTYTFTASDLSADGVEDKAKISDGTYLDEDNYFKVEGSTIQQRVSSSATTSIELGKAETGNIVFTVTGTAEITLVYSSTGGSNSSDVALLNTTSDGLVEDTAGATINSLTGTTKTTVTYTGIEAGTYSIVCPTAAHGGTNTGRGARIYSVVVTETAASSVTQTASYTFTASDLSADGVEDKAKISDGTYLDEDNYFKVEGSTIQQRVSSSATTSIELGKAETGNIVFTVTGTAEITLVYSSTGGSNSSDVALLNTTSDGLVEDTAGATINSLTGTTKTTVTYTGIEAGTYSIVCPTAAHGGTNTGRGARIYSVVVTETISSVETISLTPTITGLPSGYSVKAGDTVLTSGTAVDLESKSLALTVVNSEGTEDTDYRATVDGSTTLKVGSYEDGGSFTVVVGSAFVTPTVSLSGVELTDGNKVTVTNTTTETDAAQTVSADGDVLKLRIDDKYQVSTEDDSDTKAVVGSSDTFTATSDMTELEITVSSTALTPTVYIDETEVELGNATLTLTASGATEGVTYTEADGFGKLEFGTVYTLSCSDDSILAQINDSTMFTMTEDTDKIVVVLATYQEGLNVIDITGGLYTGVEYDGGLTVMQDMPYTASSGSVAGSSNPRTEVGGSTNAKGTVPAEGAVVIITAQTDGKFKVTTKNNSKDQYFVDGTTGTYDVQTQAASGTQTYSYQLEEGHTYYFYAAASKVVIYSITIDYRDPISWDSIMTPVLSTPVVDSAAGTITVPFTAQVGGRYADSVDIRMIKDGELIETISYTDDLSKFDTGSVTFTPSVSGTYEFQAIAARAGEVNKTSETVEADYFVLPMAQPTIIDAENQGSGNIRFTWNEVTEAESYDVYLDGEYVGSTTEAVYHFTGLTVGQSYGFSVLANGNGTTGPMSEVFTQTITSEAQKTWQFRTYGSSTSNSSKDGDGVLYDSYSEVNENDPEGVSVWSLGGKGKLVPNSTDGIAFYYTTMDPTTENFTLTADITVDQWTYSNGQEGFGIMAADTVGTDGDSSSIWNNSYMATVTKVEYYWDATNETVSDAGTKYGMYLGVGAQEKKGVTKENIEGMADGSRTDEFSSTMTTLDTSAVQYDTEGVGGNYNIVGNLTNSMDKAVTVEERTTFHLSIQRNNTGYIISYTDENGNTTSQTYYHGDDGDELTKLDANNIYLGFFASRNAKITVNNVSLTTISPEDDAPAEEREITYVTTKIQFESASISNSQDYDLVYYGNVDGILKLTCDSGTLVESMEVTAETKYHFPVTVYSGYNTFVAEVIPDEDYTPSKYEKMTDYSVQRTSIKVLYGDIGRNVIYVSPEGGEYAQGTREDPMAVTKAVKFAQPGDQIIVMEGTYSFYETLVIERGIDGTADEPIYMFADPEATSRPVFDFNKACAGMIIAGDYWYFQGFDVTNSADGQKGIQVSGSNNTLDDIMTYKNGNTGIQIARYKSTDLWEDWPANNLILNCTSFLNADSGYEDADGFAAKLTVADGNVFDGCIAAYNADDGWDCYAKVETGSIGQVTIKNSLAFMNGYILDDSGNLVNAGNGNGFKMGGESLTGYHTLINSVAFANKAKGIDSNSCPDIQIYSSTSYDNESYNVAFYTNNAKNTDFLADGVLSYKTSNSVSEQLKPAGLQDTTKIYATNNYFYNGSGSVNTKGTAVSDDWFVSLDTDAAIAGFMAYVGGQSGSGICRNADNTINMNGYLVLTDAAPSDTGARLEGAGTASAEISVQGLVLRSNDDDDDDDDSSSSQGSSSSESESVVQPVQKTSTKKAVVSTDIAKQGDETVKKLIINQNLDWDDVDKVLEELIKEAGDSKAVLEVELGKYYELSVDIVKAIQNKDITLRLTQGNGVIWEINGKDITNPIAASMKVDLNSTAISDDKLEIFKDYTSVLQFSLEHDGEFGFKALMKFPVDSTYNGQYANLFYFNSDGEFEFVSSSKVAVGYAEFEFTHASDYVVVIAETALQGVPESSENVESSEASAGEASADVSSDITSQDVEETSGGNSIIIILGIIAVLVIIGIAAIIVLKRRDKEEE